MQQDSDLFSSAHDDQFSQENLDRNFPAEIKPYEKVQVKLLSRGDVKKKFPKVFNAAENFKPEGITESEDVMLSRRFIGLMWLATKFARDNEKQEPGKLVSFPSNRSDKASQPTQASLFPDAKKEIIKSQAEKLELFIEANEELKACLSCFHLMRQEEIRKKSKIGYLDRYQVPASQDINSLQVRKGQSYTATHIASRIVAFGKAADRPMVTALGYYFQYQLEKRKDEIRLANMQSAPVYQTPAQTIPLAPATPDIQTVAQENVQSVSSSKDVTDEEYDELSKDDHLDQYKTYRPG